MTPAMLCAFALLGIIALAALLVAAVALIQTRSICQRLADHERVCQQTDNDIYQRVEQHNKSNHQLLIDISSSMARLEGYIAARDRINGGDSRSSPTAIPGMLASPPGVSTGLHDTQEGRHGG